ncbi:hypothetical protein BASA62_010064 [Batrachochytrium salamandrivorans]|nr:hypothetical protein BASA62_010064 [Batrachochytrium salamandrivorans]
MLTKILDEIAETKKKGTTIWSVLFSLLLIMFTLYSTVHVVCDTSVDSAAATLFKPYRPMCHSAILPAWDAIKSKWHDAAETVFLKAVPTTVRGVRYYSQRMEGMSRKAMHRMGLVLSDTMRRAVERAPPIEDSVGHDAGYDGHDRLAGSHPLDHNVIKTESSEMPVYQDIRSIVQEHPTKAVPAESVLSGFEVAQSVSIVETHLDVSVDNTVLSKMYTNTHTSEVGTESVVSIEHKAVASDSAETTSESLVSVDSESVTSKLLPELHMLTGTETKVDLNSLESSISESISQLPIAASVSSPASFIAEETGHPSAVKVDTASSLGESVTFEEPFVSYETSTPRRHHNARVRENKPEVVVQNSDTQPSSISVPIDMAGHIHHHSSAEDSPNTTDTVPFSESTTTQSVDAAEPRMTILPIGDTEAGIRDPEESEVAKVELPNAVVDPPLWLKSEEESSITTTTSDIDHARVAATLPTGDSSLQADSDDHSLGSHAEEAHDSGFHILPYGDTTSRIRDALSDESESDSDSNDEASDDKTAPISPLEESMDSKLWETQPSETTSSSLHDTDIHEEL